MARYNDVCVCMCARISTLFREKNYECVKSK